MQYPLLLLLLFFVQFAKSQDLWYLSHTHIRYQTSYQVLQKLYTSSNENRKIPYFEIEKRGENPPQNAPVAYYNAMLEEIVIEEELWDLCHNFGQDSIAALAFVLGHELAHHNLGHTSSEFCPFHSQNIDKEIDSLSLQQEMMADKMANFYARLADYSPCAVGKQFISEVYAAFLIPKNPNYPSLEERISLLQHNCESADTLADLFFVAKKLANEGYYEPSIQLMQHIQQQFPSKEMYLNIALAKIQWLVNEGFDTSDSIYQMPFLFEEKIHFRQGMSPTAMRQQIKKRELYLKESQAALAQALLLDKAYIYAKLYQVYLLYLIQKNKKITSKIALDLPKDTAYFSPQEQAAYLTLQAIEAACNGEKTKAKQYLQNISIPLSSTAYNLCLVEKKEFHPKEKTLIMPPAAWQTSEKFLLFQQGDLRVEKGRGFFGVREKENVVFLAD